MRRFKMIFLVLLLLTLAAGAVLWYSQQRAFRAQTGFEGTEQVVLIPTGCDFDRMVDTLVRTGVVTDTTFLRQWASLRKFRSVKPGRYVVRPGMSLNDVVLMLRRGEQRPVRVTFTNVRTIPELAGRVSRYLEPDSASILKALRDPAIMEEHGLVSETFISLFLPNTYEFWWTTTPEAFIARMAKEHDSFWTPERLEKAKALDLDPAEVATLASIVQAETIRSDEAPRIAGVYLNRLRIGMPLQADPTLKFALGADSIQRVLDVDKQVDSPYNTYRYAGLPPGPINMPEPRNIDAVLNAEHHKFLYFCARADMSGYHDLARTYDQHLVNARRYQRALNERRIYR